MRAALAGIVALVLIACSSQTALQPTPSPTPVATLSVAADGCGSTAVVRGGIPAWLETAGGHNNPTGLRYVIGHPTLVAGFLFSDPLRAGHPENPSNKVLWVVRTPRDGSSLTIDGHPLGATEPRVHLAQPANSGPGEIAAVSDVSWPAVSQNLGILKRSGLVIERRAGTRRYYRADRLALGPLEVILRQMWVRDVGRLKDLAEREARLRRRRND